MRRSVSELFCLIPRGKCSAFINKDPAFLVEHPFDHFRGHILLRLKLAVQSEGLSNHSSDRVRWTCDRILFCNKTQHEAFIRSSAARTGTTHRRLNEFLHAVTESLFVFFKNNQTKAILKTQIILSFINSVTSEIYAEIWWKTDLMIFNNRLIKETVHLMRSGEVL